MAYACDRIHASRRRPDRNRNRHRHRRPGRQDARLHVSVDADSTAAALALGCLSSTRRRQVAGESGEKGVRSARRGYGAWGLGFGTGLASF